MTDAATAQGHTVGLAQRMEQLADPGKAAYLSEPPRGWWPSCVLRLRRRLGLRCCARRY